MYEEAASICRTVGGHLVEIFTTTELEFLTNISDRFWQGVKKNVSTGYWQWEQAGNEVYSGLWHTVDYGDNKETRALFEKNPPLFIPAPLRPEETDVICETPSKFAASNRAPPPSPFPKPQGITLPSEEGIFTYFFSRYKLPWDSAQRFCREKGGWLAEIHTEMKNRELQRKNEPGLGQPDRGLIWLGAKTIDSEWRWSHSMVSFEERFTNWKAGTRAMSKGNEPRCLAQNERWWEHAPCINSNHFVCEFSPEIWVPEEPNPARFYGKKRCFEKNWNGTRSVDETDCFYFVKLQYSKEMARKFCRKYFNGSLAQMDMDQRYHPELGQTYSDTTSCKRTISFTYHLHHLIK